MVTDNFLSSQVKVGIGIEDAAAWGVGVPPAVLLPVSPPTITEPTDVIVDTALRGGIFRDWESYEGPLRVEGTLEGNLHVAEFGYLLAAFLGKTPVEKTQLKMGPAEPSAYRFEAAAQNRGLSIQVEDQTTPSTDPRRYVGNKIGSLELRIAAGEAAAITFTASFTGKTLYRKADGTGKFGADAASPTAIPADKTVKPLLGWMGSIGLGGTGVITITGATATADGALTPNPNNLAGLGTSFAKLVECTITMEREIQTVYSEQNQRIPGAIVSGPLGITATATIQFNDWADMQRYREKFQGNFFLMFTYNWPATGDVPDTTTRGLWLRFPKMDFGEAAAEIDFGAVSPALSYSMRALYDDTLKGIVELVLLHDRAITYLA